MEAGFFNAGSSQIDKAQDGDRVGIKTDNNKKGAGPDWLTP